MSPVECNLRVVERLAGEWFVEAHISGVDEVESVGPYESETDAHEAADAIRDDLAETLKARGFREAP